MREGSWKGAGEGRDLEFGELPFWIVPVHVFRGPSLGVLDGDSELGGCTKWFAVCSSDITRSAPFDPCPPPPVSAWHAFMQFGCVCASVPGVDGTPGNVGRITILCSGV